MNGPGQRFDRPQLGARVPSSLRMIVRNGSCRLMMRTNASRTRRMDAGANLEQPCVLRRQPVLVELIVQPQTHLTCRQRRTRGSIHGLGPQWPSPAPWSAVRRWHLRMRRNRSTMDSVCRTRLRGGRSGVARVNRHRRRRSRCRRRLRHVQHAANDPRHDTRGRCVGRYDAVLPRLP